MTDLRSAVNDYLAVRRQPGSPEVMSKSGAGCRVARVPISISDPDLHRRALFALEASSSGGLSGTP